MAARGIVVIILTTLLSPMVSANTGPSFTDGVGAILPDKPDEAPITYQYSPAIRAAFARLSDVQQYSQEDRD